MPEAKDELSNYLTEAIHKALRREPFDPDSSVIG
jgi:hypothetical protein